MESISHQEEEETDRSPPGTAGRSYECVFCKRGLTTAQALGGHMNIHRKDKANNKTKPTTFVIPSSLMSSSSSKADSDHHLGFYYFSSIPRGTNNNNNVYEVDSDYSSSNYYHHLHGYFPPPKERNLTFCNNNNNPSSSSSCVAEVKGKVQDNSDEGGGLDLELRLGHHHP